MSLRIRHLAEVNPSTNEFDRLPDSALVTFMPLETVWADQRLDTSRQRRKGEVSTGYTRFRCGDVLVPKVTPTFQAGRSTLVSNLRNGVGAGTTELHILRPRPHVDARFLRYVVLSKPFLTEGVTAFQGVAGLQRVPDEFVRDFPVADVPLEEQRRVADFLDAETTRLDSLASSQKKLRRLLSERRAAAIHSTVTGGDQAERHHTDLPWARALPSHWKTVKITFVAKLGSGHTPSRSVPEWWTDCTIPWITTGEVAQVRSDRTEVIRDTREKISLLGLANSAAELHPKGTVVLSRTASAGFSAVMGSDMATSQDYVTWTCTAQLDPFYLLWCLRAMRADLLERLAMGSTHKTIYFPDVQSLRIPLPPLDEQHKIVGSIRQSNTRIDHLVDTIDRQLQLLTERRQALITAAVTGQLDVTTARSGVRG